MIDREKVIEGLEKIAEFFNARGDMAVGDGKMLLLSWMRAAEDALALLKAKDLRVMTLEDMAYNIRTNFIVLHNDTDDVQVLRMEDYGVTWRCWTEKLGIEPKEGQHERDHGADERQRHAHRVARDQHQHAAGERRRRVRHLVLDELPGRRRLRRAVALVRRDERPEREVDPLHA